jgi:hypothetical protein
MLRQLSSYTAILVVGLRPVKCQILVISSVEVPQNCLLK